MFACASDQAAVKQDQTDSSHYKVKVSSESPTDQTAVPEGSAPSSAEVSAGSKTLPSSIRIEMEDEAKEKEKAEADAKKKDSAQQVNPFVSSSPERTIESLREKIATEPSEEEVKKEFEAPVHRFTASKTASVSNTLADAEDEALSGGGGNGEAASPSLSQDEAFMLNFDDMDLHEVIVMISEILGMNYIVDPQVTGKVNIHTKDKVSKKELMPIFEALLKVNNAAIIKKDNLYHIVPVASLKQDYMPTFLANKEDLPTTDKVIFQIVPLKYIAAEEIVKIVKPFMTPQGSETIAKDTILIMLDYSANIKKIMSLIELFDVDVFDRLHVNLYEAKYSDVEEMTKELDEVFKSFELPSETARGGGITFVPVTRLNMILAVSANQALVDKAVQWAERMDTEVSDAATRIFVYYVQNGRAQEIYDVLAQVFMGEAAGPTTQTQFQSKMRERTSLSERNTNRNSSRYNDRNRERETQKKTPQSTALPRRTTQGEEQERRGGLTGNVAFVVDERNNALITEASERDYRIIERTIKQLDIYPKQVLIEVYIAEIRLDDDLRLGVEWWYQNEVGDGTYRIDSTGIATPPATDKDGDGIVDAVTTGLASEIPAGLKWVIGDTDRYYAELRAFAAKGKANIISSPHVIATDNHEATIEITEEVPIQTASLYPTSDNDYYTSETEYRDTGIILTVTPHINDKGLVSLEVSQEVSEISEKTLQQGTGNPIFLKRLAETTMTVQDGQTVIIGGLITEQKNKRKAGIPYLSSIPVIGWLFGFNNDTANRSELMLMLTPHVITSIQDADDITKEFRSKLSVIEDGEKTGTLQKEVGSVGSKNSKGNR